MGLDITAYKNLKVVENPLLDNEGYPINYDTEWLPGSSMVWSEENFPGRGEGINSNFVYAYDDRIDFYAGSYFGYNWWRDNLELISDGISFVELIDFADNEGVIGYVVADKLYKDFITNYEKAIEFSKTINNGENWLVKYCDWMNSFNFARQKGAIEFH